MEGEAELPHRPRSPSPECGVAHSGVDGDFRFRLRIVLQILWSVYTQGLTPEPMNTQAQDPELEMTKQLIQAVIDKLHELKGDNEYQSISEGIDVLIDKYTDALRIFELRSKDEKLSYHWKGTRLEKWIVTHSNVTHTTSYDKQSNLFNIEEGEYNFITWRGDKAEYIGVGKRYDGYVPASNRHPDLVFEENNEAKRKIGIEAKFFYFTYDGDTDASKEEQIKKAFQSKIDSLTCIIHSRHALSSQ